MLKEEIVIQGDVLPEVNRRPHVALVGGPDLDQRIDLMQRLKHNFLVYGLGSSRDLRGKFRQEGFIYLHYRLARRINPIMDIISILQLLRNFRRNKPDIVHSFDTKPCVLARVAARLADVSVIVGTLPGLGSLYARRGVVTTVVRSFYEALQKHANNCSDMTIFQNHEDAQEFLERGLVKPNKICVLLGSGIRTELFSQTAVQRQDIERARKELGVKDGDLVVTMISRLIRSKGVLQFHETAKLVKDRHDKVHFILVGPDDRESIDRLTSREIAGLSRGVNWLGERRDVPVILALSDIFVLPSYYREGIPRVLLEAASMGLPLVSVRSAGCVEVVRDGVNGILVPPRDSKALATAIETLVQNDLLRQAFGRAARELAVNRFDLSIIAKETEGLYRRLLLQKRGINGAACDTLFQGLEP